MRDSTKALLRFLGASWLLALNREAGREFAVVRLWGYEWLRDGLAAYLHGPGVRYREFPDLVVLEVARCVKYHRVGFASGVTVGRLFVYRKVAGIRTFVPSFKFF